MRKVNSSGTFVPILYSEIYQSVYLLTQLGCWPVLLSR